MSPITTVNEIYVDLHRIAHHHESVYELKLHFPLSASKVMHACIKKKVEYMLAMKFSYTMSN